MSRAVALLLTSGLLAAACATRAPAPARQPAPAPAVNVEHLIARGCYTCLEEAFAIASAAGAHEAAFQHAAQCFELAVLTRRKAVAELTAGAESASAVARQVDSHERAIAEADARRLEAVTNIASIERRLAILYTGDGAAPAPSSP